MHRIIPTLYRVSGLSLSDFCQYGSEHMNPWRFFTVFVMVTFMTGCTFHQQWRKDLAVCRITSSSASDSSKPECENATIQEFPGEAGYQLGFVEFNDQGEAFDPGQLNFVLNNIYQKSARNDVIMVVFAHGWQHRAKANDGNILTFREVLEGVSRAEHANLEAEDGTKRTPREVVGVYVGWRGLSLKVPGLKHLLTFWDRKNTAAKVGDGDVSVLLSKIEQVKTTKDAIVRNEEIDLAKQRCEKQKKDACLREIEQAAKARSLTRLVVIGHSFGGLVVQNAINQILLDRAVATVGSKLGVQSEIEGFGNLVVLINPAFEAQRYAPLFKLEDERKSYLPEQLPVQLILTSEADWATHYAFPIGRALSSTFEKKGWSARNLQATGHYTDFITHHLSRPSQKLAPAVSTEGCSKQPASVAQAWMAGDKMGESQTIAGLVLRRDLLSERAPFLNVSVSGDLISGHNDLDSPEVIDFIKGMINLAAITDKEKARVASQAASLRKAMNSQDLNCP